MTTTTYPDCPCCSSASCCVPTPPSTLYATLVSSTGDCNCAPASITLTQSGSLYIWSGISFGTCGIDLGIRCDNGVWVASCETMGDTATISVQCGPFDTTVTLCTNPAQPNKPCTGCVTYHITE